MKNETLFCSKGIYRFILFFLLILLIFSLLTAITFGNADISIIQIYQVILYELTHKASLAVYASGPIHDVIWLIRLPRVLLAAEIGMSLAVSGAVMQAVVRNPLADPYVLGISSGACLGATLAILFGIGSFLGIDFVGLMGFAGAFAASLLVLSIAGFGSSSSSVGRLILAGMAVNSVCSAFSDFALYLANDRNATAEVTYWLFGSLSGANYKKVLFLFPVFFLCILFLWTQSRSFNLMLLGDETAITLGHNLKKYRILYLLLISCMVGFSVYAAGMIGFIGLIVPHAVRILFGTDYRRLIPVCAYIGAIFLVWADVASRIILKNSEMPVGILVSMIGAPCFIYLMVKRTNKSGKDC